MRNISAQELSYRYNAIKENLQISSDEIMDMLIETRRQDDMGIEEIIRGEGAKQSINNFLLFIEDSFLSDLDIKEIYKYKDIETSEWDFLSFEEQSLLKNTESFYKEIYKDYMLNRAYLMIMRKEVTNFVEVTLKKINSKPSSEKFNEIVNYIINNYTYADTMKALGFDVQQDKETQEILLARYRLDEETLRYKL